MLNTRYSGEYIQFGTGENNLYRIVSHENGTGIKITSVEPLKDSGIFITSAFGDSVNYSSSSTIGTFLNGEYLMSYLGDNYSEMIEDNTTWYLGTVGLGESYKLAKYTDATGNTATSNVTQAKVGLLRIGELMAGQFNTYSNNINYLTLTPCNSSDIWFATSAGSGGSSSYSISSRGIRPSLNLKSNVVITGGDGTKENPFTLELG